MFNIGDAVQFTSSRKHKTVVGVVMGMRKVSKRYQPVVYRFEVKSEEEGMYTVPEHMLKPAKLTPKQRKVLYAAGNEFKEERQAHREEHKEKAAEYLKNFGYIERLRVGQMVEVLSNGMWSKSQVVRINKTTGKVTVLNPKKMLDLAFGGHLARITGRAPKDLITVWANRVKPII